jgi:hypothetical protein
MKFISVDARGPINRINLEDYPNENHLVIKKNDSSTEPVIIQAPPGGNIDGSPNYILTVQLPGILK